MLPHAGDRCTGEAREGVHRAGQGELNANVGGVITYPVDSRNARNERHYPLSESLRSTRLRHLSVDEPGKLRASAGAPMPRTPSC